MSNFKKLMAVVMVLAVVLGCSVQRHHEATQAGRQSGLDGLAQTWGEPNTIMNLTNGNRLYVFGQGRDTRIATPVRAIPGHSLVMISEDGKAPRIVHDREQKLALPATQTTQRIVWVETNRDGGILLAGCSGCTEEEDHVLAMQVRREREGKALAKSTDYTDYTD